MKLTEGVVYDKNTLKILGIVDMDVHTPDELRGKEGDHALVILFQPFKGRWMQTVAAFLTKGAAKGKELAKIVLDAVTRLDQCGFHTDVIVSDGAPWNRTMWAELGMLRSETEKELDTEEEDILAGLETVEEWETTLDLDFLHSDDATTSNVSSTSTKRQQGRGKKGARSNKKSAPPKPKKKSKAKLAQEHRSNFVSCPHPLDSKRRMWFVSDFPHLIKSIKERILNREILKVNGKFNLHLQFLSH